MTIKKILALSGNPQTNNSVLASALCIARNFSAHIDFTHVRGVPDPYATSMIEALPAEVLKDIEREQERWIQETEDSIRGSFNDFVAREDLATHNDPDSADEPSASWVSIIGSTPDVIEERGGAYDLIVVGRPLGPSSPPMQPWRPRCSQRADRCSWRLRNRRKKLAKRF